MRQKNISIKIPKSWNELSDRQLKLTALVFHTTSPGLIFDIRVLYILMNIRWWHLGKKIKLHFVLSQVPLSELKKHYSYIYKERNRTVFLPYMITKKEAYFSPMENMSNITAGEFAVADDLSRLWQKNKTRNVLEYLAAVLYSTAPNIRPRFEKDDLAAKAELFKKVPLKELLAMKLAYDGCYESITKRYPRAFPKNGPSASQDAKKKYGFGDPRNVRTEIWDA